MNRQKIILSENDYTLSRKKKILNNVWSSEKHFKLNFLYLRVANDLTTKMLKPDF